MIYDVQSYIYIHLKKVEEIWFRRLMKSEHWNNANVWNGAYRISTEKSLLKNLREWDNYAWWETQYLGWRVRQTWDTMISVVKKLINGDETCLDVICYIFIMEKLRLKFYEVKAEIEQAKKPR